MDPIPIPALGERDIELPADFRETRPADSVARSHLVGGLAPNEIVEFLAG